jgi:2-oxo-3-hexenedioate decarboxylase
MAAKNSHAKTSQPDVKAIAAEMLAITGTGRSIAPFSSRPAGLTLDDAWRVSPLLRTAFEARGEKILGRKIGFTNRTIWPEYGVDAPNWGYITDRTTSDLGAISALSLKPFSEPKIEPEIMFGLKTAPSPDKNGRLDDAAILRCVDWVAHGFEIVQSVFPNWRFAPADTVACNAMHGALLIGPRHPVGPDAGEWLRTLSTFEVELYRDDQLMERGGGAQVLEGPLSTILFVANLLANDPNNPPLVAGEIISTGTLTRARSIRPGETWTTRLRGIALDGIGLRLA